MQINSFSRNQINKKKRIISHPSKNTFATLYSRFKKKNNPQEDVFKQLSSSIEKIASKNNQKQKVVTQKNKSQTKQYGSCRVGSWNYKSNLEIRQTPIFDDLIVKGLQLQRKQFSQKCNKLQQQMEFMGIQHYQFSEMMKQRLKNSQIKIKILQKQNQYYKTLKEYQAQPKNQQSQTHHMHNQSTQQIKKKDSESFLIIKSDVMYEKPDGYSCNTLVMHKEVLQNVSEQDQKVERPNCSNNAPQKGTECLKMEHINTQQQSLSNDGSQFFDTANAPDEKYSDLLLQIQELKQSLIDQKFKNQQLNDIIKNITQQKCELQKLINRNQEKLQDLESELEQKNQEIQVYQKQLRNLNQKIKKLDQHKFPNDMHHQGSMNTFQSQIQFDLHLKRQSTYEEYTFSSELSNATKYQDSQNVTQKQSLSKEGQQSQNLQQIQKISHLQQKCSQYQYELNTFKNNYNALSQQLEYLKKYKAENQNFINENFKTKYNQNQDGTQNVCIQQFKNNYSQTSIKVSHQPNCQRPENENQKNNQLTKDSAVEEKEASGISENNVNEQH